MKFEQNVMQAGSNPEWRLRNLKNSNGFAPVGDKKWCQRSENGFELSAHFAIFG